MQQTPHSSKTSRREFLADSLRASLGLCAFTALGEVASFAADAPAPPHAHLRFGFTTYQWGKDWDIPTLIANLTKAQVFGTELRTSMSYAHGVELTLSAGARAEVKKRFADSPVTLVGMASGERMDWPEAAKLKTAIENAKRYAKLSHDVGGSGVRVFPNQFHPGVPHDQTIEQIARSLNEVGASAADYGQEIRLEAHGPAGDLVTIRQIMERVTQPNVRIKLNSDARDAHTAAEFETRFNGVRRFLGHTAHIHNLEDKAFPYQLQANLLAKTGWDGWALLEVSHKVPDRVEAIIAQRHIWEKLVATAMKMPA